MFRDWLAKYDGKVMNIPLPTLVHRMESLSSWKADMLKARKKEDVENFLDSDFDLTVSAGQLSASSDPEGECLSQSSLKRRGGERDSSIPRKAKQSGSFEAQFLANLGVQLLQETAETKALLLKSEEEKLALREKLKTYAPKVRNQRHKRNLKKISQLKNEIKQTISQLKNEIKQTKVLLQKKAATLNKLEMVSEVHKHRSGEYRRFKKKYLSTKKSKMNVTKSLQEQKKIVSDMKQKLAGLQNLEKQYEDMKIRQKELCDRLRELEVQNSMLQEASTSIQTWVGNHSTAAFTDDVRKVCYFLVSKYVAAGNIGPVIKYTIETLAKKQNNF